MNKQKGMTFIGMLFTAALVCLGAILLIQVIPVYLQHYTIVSSIKSLNETPTSSLSADDMLNQQVLKRDLDKRLEINNVGELKDQNLKIDPLGDNKFKITFKYQVVRHVVYNVSLLFDFDDTIEVKAGSEN